ncbi:bifunctional nuclease domain-containing protein [Bacteroides sp.]
MDKKKVELQVLSISNSQAQVGAFAMVLGEVDGERQLPIIIGPTEAQATSLYLKGMKTPRPLTHDLFYSCLSVLGAIVLRILIYEAKDGVFYSYIYLRKGEEIIRIDARTSDAVALAVRADCPILIYESILERECIHLADADAEISEIEETEEEGNNASSQKVNLSALEEALNKAIKEEKYELAAKLRDEIRRHK